MDVFSSIENEVVKGAIVKLHYRKNDFKKKNILERIFSPIKILMSRPACITIETVNYCNHDCIFCPNSVMTRERSIMPMKVFEKIINDYLEIGGGHLSLTPMIGDIFLDTLLIQRLEYLNQFSDYITLSVTTNGVLADNYSDNELSYIVGKFKRVNISVYGLNDEEYFLITKKNTYKRFLSSIKRIVTLAPPGVVTLGFRLLNSCNENKLKSWIMENIGAIIPYSSTIQYDNWSCNQLSFELPGDASWTNQQVGNIPCIIPLISIQIFVNGDVSMCACADFDSSSDLRIGTICTDSLESMYNSEKVKNFFSKPWKTPEFCKKCSFYRSLYKSNQEWIDNPVTLIGG